MTGRTGPREEQAGGRGAAPTGGPESRSLKIKIRIRGDGVKTRTGSRCRAAWFPRSRRIQYYLHNDPGITMTPAHVTAEQVRDALRTVQEPELHRDLITLDFVRDIQVHGIDVSFTVTLTTPACP